MAQQLEGEHDGSKRHKAKLVVKGCQQKKGIDYSKLFFFVVKLNTIRTILSSVLVEDLYLEQFNVIKTFLHGNLQDI